MTQNFDDELNNLIDLNLTCGDRRKERFKQQIKSLCFKSIGKRLMGEIESRKKDVDKFEFVLFNLELATKAKGYNEALNDIRKVFKDVLNIE